uniref:Pyrin domain-containing protein n=1 Tax=Xiphophorus maculatus TaxID=8083 RepID=M4AHK5_XIPMA
VGISGEEGREELLLDSLEQLNRDEFQTFKWYLQQHELEGHRSIPTSYLEQAERTKTVSKMIENYTEDVAVTVAVTILKKQQRNDLAQKLSNAHPGDYAIT